MSCSRDCAIHRTLLAATIASSMSGVAAAQMPLPSFEPAPPLTGLYIGAGAGFNWLQNEHLINAVGTATNAAVQSHFGCCAVGSIGWALPYGLRVEIEGDYRNDALMEGAMFHAALRNCSCPTAAAIRLTASVRRGSEAAVEMRTKGERP